MIEIKNYLKTLLALESDQNVLYQRNILKEYFQIILLNYIYSDQKYSGLIFYGGSSLAHCYDLPRLSEDLDFIDSTKKIDLNILASDLKSFFDKQTDLKPIIRIQKFRIELKFPVLSDLGLISEKKSESDLLIIKLEIYPDSLIVKNSQIEIVPLFKFHFVIGTNSCSVLISTRGVTSKKPTSSDILLCLDSKSFDGL